MKPINTIATQWELFKRECMMMDGTEDKDDIERWRALFYGGAAALVHTIDAGKPAEMNAHVNRLKEELGDYAREVRTKYGGSTIPAGSRR